MNRKAQSLLNRKLIIYILKFLSAFCILYFGTLAIIGLAAPGNYYSDFIARHLNFVSWLRASLLQTSKLILSLFGYIVYFENDFVIRLQSGTGIRMVYSCVGYGVMSFWGAFIIANAGKWNRKLKWIIGGWLIIWIVNVIRICLVFYAANKGSLTFMGLDHHTWFNIAAYFFIFLLIYFYDKSEKE